MRLVDIGYSDKAATGTKAARNAGFRGIGRMAGISHCQRLVFETSDGGPQVCRVTFDADSINRLTRPGQEPATIAQAISDNCSIVELSCDTRMRYLEVRLEA